MWQLKQCKRSGSDLRGKGMKFCVNCPNSRDNLKGFVSFESIGFQRHVQSVLKYFLVCFEIVLRDQ